MRRAQPSCSFVSPGGQACGHANMKIRSTSSGNSPAYTESCAMARASLSMRRSQFGRLTIDISGPGACSPEPGSALALAGLKPVASVSGAETRAA